MPLWMKVFTKSVLTNFTLGLHVTTDIRETLEYITTERQSKVMQHL